MKFKIFGKQFEVNIKNQSIPNLSNDSQWQSYLKGLGYGLSSDNALKVAVVIRCCDVVAKTMSSLGCYMYLKTKDGRQKAENHNLFNIVRVLPNPETTSYEFWHMYIFNLMLTSGAYAKIVRDKNGFITELWNIPTKNVVLQRNSITKERYIDVVYDYQSHEKVLGERLYENDFMYTPGLRFSDDGKSEDFIYIASEVLGLTSNLNSYANDFFENGSNLGGFVVYPGKVNDTAFLKFKNDWSKTYAGVKNQHKWAILEGGFDLKPMSSEPEKAQALESRKFQVIEVCRLFGIPPHKVFSMEDVNYSSMEQSNIEYVQETISPMDERICQTLYKDVLSDDERLNYYYKFNINKLLQGDMAARTGFYSMMRQNGIYSTNDILELEDRNSISEEDGGNIRLINGALIPLSEAKNNQTQGGANNA